MIVRRKSGAQSGIVLSAPLEKVCGEIADVAGFLWKNGWAEANGGNISVDVTDYASGSAATLDDCPYKAMHHAYPELAGRCFAATGTWTRMREVTRNWNEKLCIVRMDDVGEGYHVVWRDNDIVPTSELNSHFGIHAVNRRLNRTATAVIHTHPDELIALSHFPEFNDQIYLNNMLWSMVPEAVVVLPHGVGVVRYELTGSPAIEAATVKAMEDHTVCLWEKHGAIATGEGVYAAFDQIEVANKAARLLLLCLHAGRKPEGLTPAQITELRDKFFGAA